MQSLIKYNRQKKRVELVSVKIQKNRYCLKNAERIAKKRWFLWFFWYKTIKSAQCAELLKKSDKINDAGRKIP